MFYLPIFPKLFPIITHITAAMPSAHAVRLVCELAAERGSFLEALEHDPSTLTWAALLDGAAPEAGGGETLRSLAILYPAVLKNSLECSS